MRRIWRGTSGWSYDHWQGVFYPEDLSKNRYLEHYATVSDTVEVNSTFYHTPCLATTEKGHERTPPGFLFALKGSRFISHHRELLDCTSSLPRPPQTSEIYMFTLITMLVATPRKMPGVCENYLALIDRPQRL